jgi:DNA polymerase-3 subunit alpha
MKFTHLHVHSHYSLLTAPAKIEDLLAHAKELGMTSIALTDNSNMYGAVDIYVKAKDTGINVIIGAQVNVCKDLNSKNNTAEDRRRYDLVLLAKDETGYKNLMKIISIAQIEGFYYKPRVDKQLLRQYHEGLIALSGSVTGEVPSLVIMGNDARARDIALEYQDIFGKDHFYLEIQPHPDYENQLLANEGLIQISRETGIPLVATNDVHYIRKEDAEIQDILLCIQNNWKVSDVNRLSFTHLDLSLRSQEEMIEAFKDTPDAIENTQKIADMCHVKIRLGETQLPHFEVPVGFDSESYLSHLCELGLTKRYGDTIESKHRERMEYELGIIEKTGFASYFLIVQDFVNWAKNAQIMVGPGRGSAAGSFVAYLTGITNIDPIEYTLLFERFLNPERISMPDVDMDFADDRRDEVLNYVREKYGHDHVAQIITFGTMAARAAIRDTGRALGYSYALCDQVAKLIPMFTTMKEALEEAVDFKKLYESDPDAHKLIDVAKNLEGLARHASMHACGVVITKDPVTEYTPIQKISGTREGTVTQYASSTKFSAVEKIGLLKMDFLGLKNLTIMQNAIRIIRALGKLDELITNIGLDPKTASISDIMDRLPIDDAKTYKLLQKAHTTGVFQLESNGMKRYLRQLKPTVLEDIIAMVALYRPGPMEWIPDFIDGKHGRKTVQYLHPKLEPILSNTYGVAVYQEQVMQIARDLAGFTLGEADVLRKAMGKKILALIQEQRIKFVARCGEQGISKDIAEGVFAFIEPFAGYGFNRSHAACYALIGYQTAYLKAHYPAAFMAALLTSDQDTTDRIAIEVNECREMGIEVLPPDVNESFEEFAVVPNAEGKEPARNATHNVAGGRIRFGLNAIKNVGKVAAEEIVKERKRGGKFRSIADFVERVQTKDLNKKSLDALSKVGALDAFGERNQLLASIDKILKHSRNLQKIKETHTDSLFGHMPIETSELRLENVPPIDKKQKLKWEKELLGLYVSDHPVSDFKEYFDQITVPIHDLEKRENGISIKVGGVISTVRKTYTKRQQEMFFVNLEDLTGRVEVLVFPRAVEKTLGMWIEDELVIVRGRLSNEDGVPKIIAEEAEKVDLQSVETFKRVLLTRTKNEGSGHPELVSGSRTNTSALSNEEMLKQPARNASHNDAGGVQHNAKNPRITITLQDSAVSKQLLETISSTLTHLHKGNTSIYVRVQGATIETTHSIEMTEEIKKQLTDIAGVESVEC